jgi:hypothetical protein
VRIGLVADVPDEPVVRRVEDVVQRDGQFDDAEAGAEMAAGEEAATGQVFYGKSVPSEMLLPGDQEIRRITILRDIVHESVEVSVDPRLTIVCYQ